MSKSRRVFFSEKVTDIDEATAFRNRYRCTSFMTGPTRLACVGHFGRNIAEWSLGSGGWFSWPLTENVSSAAR